MKKVHPKQAIFFIWTCNVIALSISLAYTINADTIIIQDLFSVTFIVWLILLCIARHGGLFRFVDSKISAGLGNVIEFASLIILPFPLFVLSVIISCIINIIDRVRKKHPEPFLGPDFNAASVIIAGWVSSIAFHIVYSVFLQSPLMFTVGLFLQGIIFGTIQITLLNTLICLDEKIKWKNGPVIKINTILTEGILIITGVLLATTYQYNPYLIVFFIVPALLLQEILQNASKVQLIYIDEKTGMFNYRYFDEKINELYLICKKQGTELSLIFGDMDYLREVNNSHGHSTGDQAIHAIGQIFKTSQQNQFISARFGGEEFVMILPNVDKYTAAIHAELIRKQANELELISQETKQKIALSISLGVASFPTDAQDVQTLIQMADEALYEAKSRGRNCVYVYGSHSNKNIAGVYVKDERGNIHV